jgi:hypothetical protein
VITNGAYADTHPHADPLDLISSAAFKGLDEKNGARVTHCEPDVPAAACARQRENRQPCSAAAEVPIKSVIKSKLRTSTGGYFLSKPK